MVFTGDTLFVGGVGRTDLGGGSLQQLVSSIRDKLFVLPDDTIVAPGHNYGDTPKSTIGRRRFTILMLAKELFISKFFALAIVISVLFFSCQTVTTVPTTRKGDQRSPSYLEAALPKALLMSASFAHWNRRRSQST